MRCWVPGCINDSEIVTKYTGIPFHMFPKKRNLRKSWIKSLDVLDWEPEEGSVVCSEHFKQDAFIETTCGVKKDAKPVLDIEISSMLDQNPVKDEPNEEKTVGDVEIIKIEEDDIGKLGNNDISTILKPEPVNTKINEIYTELMLLETKIKLELPDHDNSVDINKSNGAEALINASNVTSRKCLSDNVFVKQKLEGKSLSVTAGEEQKPNACRKCKFGTVDKLKSHTEEKPFCSSCDYRSKNKSLIKLKVHTERKLYECQMCDFKFSNKHSLVAHIKTHTEEKPFRCNFCDYRCCSKSSLVRHVRIHTGEKPFECQICDYRAANHGSLFGHMRTHTGEKPFACKICDYRTVHSGKLNTHMKTHTGEKPFRCNFCDYRCCRKSSLVRHVRIHTGEKPYACQKCKYQCITMQELSKHMKTHTGEKPFSCSYCSYCCSRKDNLVVHIRLHTGEKTIACRLCNYRCITRQELSKHKKTHII